jgi:hypothetical protein
MMFFDPVLAVVAVVVVVLMATPNATVVDLILDITLMITVISVVVTGYLSHVVYEIRLTLIVDLFVLMLGPIFRAAE